MKIGYVLLVLFFPAFLLIDVGSSEISEMKMVDTISKKEIDLADYNYRVQTEDQGEIRFPGQSPKNSDFSQDNKPPKSIIPSVPKDENPELLIDKDGTTPNSTKEEIVLAFDHDHERFAKVLSGNVSNSGKVNYKSIKAQEKDLQSYLDLVSKIETSQDWSKNEQLAYWINVYNAFTIKLIIDNYPINSITDLEGGKPWDKKWIQIGRKTYSLNNIENDIIRVQFNEPRIHFAVNCAAKSCPPLMNRAWTPGNLEASLERQTTNFINNSKYNLLQDKSASISKIFDWYKVDFGNLISFLNKYSTTPISPKASITFKEYDWNLNE